MRVVYALYVLTVVAALVFAEGVMLILLINQVSGNKMYWQLRSKQAGDFVYLALGDSAAQGLGASQPQKGYVGLIADRVAAQTGKSVKVVNLSVSGARVQDVVDKQIPQIGNLKPNLVTIEIGGNDVKDFDEEKFTSQYTELIRLLPKGTYVSDMPFFQTRPLRRKNAEQASKIIKRLVSTRSDLHFVGLQSATTKRNTIFGYAADFFHPNNITYRVWADTFWQVIRGQL